MKSARDLLKHSSIYGIGQILSRFASVLLLPLYTRCLSPSDYGCVAILDLTAGILAILIGGGLAQAVVRFHFEETGEDGERRVWWTGLAWVVACATAVTIPMVIGRGLLADLTLDPGVGDGAYFYLLAAGTLWCNTIASLIETWLRVRKRSLTFVGVSLGRLLLNIGLNVWFLVGLDMGVVGLLLGNFIAAVANTSALALVFANSQRGFAFDPVLLRKLRQFGTPLIVTALLSLLMHEADRYFLKHYAGLAEVGVYSLAYKIGQAVNMLFLIPFAAIWNVVMYEMAAEPDAKQNYGRVFELFTYALLIVTLAASLFAYPLLPLLTPGDYGEAVDLIPIVLLAYVLFAMHQQFSVPALLAKKTSALIPASIVGVMTNVALNLLLIPRFGATGAAWASVATYAAFSFSGLMCYRSIDRYPYPFGRLFAVGAGITATYVAARVWVLPASSMPIQLLVAAVATSVWSAVLLRPVMRPLWEILSEKLRPAAKRRQHVAPGVSQGIPDCAVRKAPKGATADSDSSEVSPLQGLRSCHPPATPG